MALSCGTSYKHTVLPLLQFITLRHWLKSTSRTAITLIGIAIGVATMSGVSAINRSVLRAFRSTIDTIAGKADLTISSGQMGFDDQWLEKVKKNPGVAHASGTVSVIAPVKDMPGERLFVLGIDLLDDGFFRTYESSDTKISSLTDDLEFLNSTDKMLVTETFAQAHQLKKGDKFSLTTSEGVQEFTIYGLIKDTGPLKAFGGSIGVMDLASAQAAFGKGRKLDRIDVALAPGTTTDQLKTNLSSILPTGFEVAQPQRRGQSVEKMLLSFQLSLNLGSAIALLVGVFLVYNTVAIGVLQRRREIGILRALGSTRLRMRALFTLEAALMGAVGSIAGLPLGGWLARVAIAGVSNSVSSLYVPVNANDVHIDSLEIVLGLFLGIAGSAAAALRPAYLASQIAPVEALRRDQAAGAGSQQIQWFPIALGAFLLLLAWPASMIPPPTENFSLGGYLSMALVLMGFSVLSPMIIQLLGFVYQKPMHLLFGISGRIASDNFSRSPVRTAIPVSALSIGVAMTVCIAGFIGSFKDSTERWIEHAVPADLFVTSSSKISGSQNVPVNESLGEDLAQIPGVAYIDLLRVVKHDVLGLRLSVLSVKPEVYRLRGKPIFVAGAAPTPEMRDNGYVTVSENIARRRNLEIGSTFEMNTPTGQHTYKVAAIMVDYTSDQGTIFLDRKIYKQQFQDDKVDTFDIYLKDPKDLEKVRHEITSKYADKYNLYVLTNRELRQSALDMVDDAFKITYAMEGLAVVLALLGVINTLLAAVLDRTREIGLVRALGGSRSHVIRWFTSEALIMGLTGGAIGVLMGLLLGNMVTRLVGVQATGWSFPFVPPWRIAVQMGVVATLCATLAGIYPARRASRLDVVEALSYE